MKSDLQSVEKGPFSTFVRGFAPKMYELGNSRLIIGWTFSKTYLLIEQFPASPGAQLQKIAVRSDWVK